MQPSCDEGGLIPVDNALQALLSSAVSVTDIQQVSLNDALNRVLAEEVTAQIDVPPFNASAMDGYALNSQDSGPGNVLPVSQRIAAGQQPAGPLALGTMARIFTGAPLPEGADTVVKQEDCAVEDGKVTLLQETESGQFVRRRGSHVGRGAVALGKGTRLGPAEIGLAASMGVGTLAVYRRLKVALLTTGDELLEPGLPLQPGQIYNANQYMLANLLRRFNCEVETIGPLSDDAAAIKSALRNAASGNDVIISSGGVSVGEEDHVKAVVESLGQIAMWRIRLKPGKPLAFGRVADTPFIGLPGNPVSSFVTFCLFARPFLLKSQGVAHTDVKTFPVVADFDQPNADKRRSYLRVNLVNGDDGGLLAQPYRSQDSATLLSTTSSDGLLCVPEGVTFERGTLLSFIPFSALLS